MLSSYLLIYCGLFASSYELKQAVTLFLFACLVLIFEDYLVANERTIIPERIRPFSDVIVFSIVFCLERPSLGVDIGFIAKLILSFKSTMASALSSGMQRGLTITLVFFAVLVLGIAAKKNKHTYQILCLSACICMITISLLGRVLIYYNGTISLINGEMALRTSLGGELYDLAVEFKNSSEDNAEFLANPDDTTNVGGFQIVSERNCYVVFKVIPSARSMVDDWYNRYMSVNSFDERTGEEIRNVMDSSEIHYVLVNSDNFNKLDEFSCFSVYLRSASDAFRVYKLD